MLSCYLRLERRQSTKKDGTESTTPRYIAVAQAGYFKPLQAIKNADNEIVMYHQRNDKCNPNSKAETRLQYKGGGNFSSVYLDGLKIGEALIGYGEPDQHQMLKPAKNKKTGKVTERANPFYENRADGFLFIISPDYETIEILVISQGRLLIRGYAAKLADGSFNETLTEIRKTAKNSTQNNELQYI